MDLVTGSYTYNHQDLSVGSGSYPDTLPFVRYFDSGQAQTGQNSSLLGIGWMHNYDMTALVDSDGFEGMGDNSPISGAASIATFYVLQDILNLGGTDTNKPTDRIIIAAQAEYWLMQQMTNNIVAVSQPGSIERFVQLPNGSYNPPLGSATVLTGSSSVGYTYQSGTGVTLTFNPTSAAASGRITNWANAAGATVAFTYNGSGQLQSVCKPGCVSPPPQRQLNFHYTGNQLTSVDDGTGSTPRTVSFGYDSLNDLNSVTDPLGHNTTFSYGAAGQLTQIYYPTHPGSPFVSMTYDTLGRPNLQADANGNLTTLRIAGTRAELDDPVGTARVSYFTPRGKTLAYIEGLGSSTINSGAGNQTTSTYDGLDRVSTTTLPSGKELSYAYDTYSNPLNITQTPITGSGLSPLVTYFTYAAPVAALPNFEEVLTSKDPLNLVTTSSYDAYGNLVTVVADSGSGHFNATRRFTYDAMGRVLTSTDPVGVVTQDTYDPAGDLISVINDYGACGPHLCQKTILSYDQVGNVISTTDPNGNATSSAYDADRRLTSVTTPPASVTALPLQTTLSYDPDGRLLQAQQSSGGPVLRTTSSTYSLAGKVTTQTDANGNVTQYGYDADDRVSSVTDAVGRTTNYTYDALSRPYQTFNFAIQSTPLEQRAYSPDGLLATLTDANSNATNYAYDGLDRLSTTTWPDSTTEVLTYDADSNVLTRKTRKGDTITLTYDTLNRLSTKAAPSEATATYTYDLDGHMIGAGDTSSAITAASPAASYTTSYTYDALNRPINTTWTPAATQATPTSSTASFA